LCLLQALTIEPAMPNKAPALLFASLLLVPLAGCNRQPPTDNEVAQAPGEPTKGVDRSHKGEAMPAAEIFNADDAKATLAEAKGKPLLVNLWASWCAPCVKELPTLDALSRKPGAPRIIAVSEDVGERPSVEAFLESHGIKDLEAWRDPKMALTGAIGVEVMPTTVYYDASGREVWRYIGDLDWNGEEAATLLAEAGESGAR
jgi:thiol-disulfide isomerase/thioredoxin